MTIRYSDNLCPRYQHAIEILGKRWTGLILKILLQGPLQFSKLAEQLGKKVVSDRVLSERLKELENEKIIHRHVIAETPVRVEYSLTEKGRALGPVVDAIEEWSHHWVEQASLLERDAPEAKEASDIESYEIAGNKV